MTGPSTIAHHEELHKRIAELEAELAGLRSEYQATRGFLSKAEAEVERLNRFHELYCHPDCDCEEASP